MKILWVNPSFLDYRIPVYEKLYKITNGKFFLIYSEKRVPKRVIAKITHAIGDNAIALPNEIAFAITPKGDFANTDFKFPYQPGLYNAMSKIDADIIIGEGFFQWTPIAIVRAKLKRKKILIAYERTAHTERNCPRWRAFYRKIISKFVDGYSVNGQLTKEYLVNLNINESKIFIGGMSGDSENLVANLDVFTREDRLKLKSKLSIQKGLTYLYVGQINERKGVIYLLMAWKTHIEKYPFDSLVIIGTGPLYDKYVEMFYSYKSIKMLGRIDYDHIYRYYGISDVFIIPTLEDNWSLVVPEAMACGLPIACSIYNGCYPELVHEDINGKLFDPLVEDTVIETLAYFHDKDLTLMGEESINIEKRFNADSVALKIYNSCQAIVR